MDGRRRILAKIRWSWIQRRDEDLSNDDSTRIDKTKKKNKQRLEWKERQVRTNKTNIAQKHRNQPTPFPHARTKILCSSNEVCRVGTCSSHTHAGKFCCEFGSMYFCLILFRICKVLRKYFRLNFVCFLKWAVGRYSSSQHITIITGNL